MVDITNPGSDADDLFDGLRGASHRASSITVAATMDIGGEPASTLYVTGTGTTTSLGTAAEGVERTCIAPAGWTLAHDGESLVMPGASTYTTAEGDVLKFLSLGSGNWRCIGRTLNRAPETVYFPALLPEPSNGELCAFLSVPDNMVVTKTKVRSSAGTGVCTFSHGGTAFNGGGHSISTSLDSVSHGYTYIQSGDDIEVTFASLSSIGDVSLSVEGYRYTAAPVTALGAWHVFDPTTLTVGRDGSGGQPGNTDVVGRAADQSGGGRYATAPSDNARPRWLTGGILDHDQIDDVMQVTAPSGWESVKVAMVYETGGLAIYGANIAAGTWSWTPSGRTPDPGIQYVGVYSASVADVDIATDVLDIDVVGSFKGQTDFTDAWYGWSYITSFPALDVSSGTDFYNAWRECSGLTSFPALDVSSGTDFYNAWRGCSGLTSFPALDVSSGTDFRYAWSYCSGLTSFPALDVSSGTDFRYAWYYCSGLTSFPAGMFDSVSATDFTNAFLNCALSEASVDNILVSVNAAGTSSGTLNITGGTNSPPSATGLSAKSSLEGRGWTVTVNT